jgi:hypothetical protein
VDTGAGSLAGSRTASPGGTWVSICSTEISFYKGTKTPRAEKEEETYSGCI